MLIFSISLSPFSFTLALHAKYIKRLMPNGINMYTIIVKIKVIPLLARGLPKTKANTESAYKVGRISPSHLFFCKDNNTCNTIRHNIANKSNLTFVTCNSPFQFTELIEVLNIHLVQLVLVFFPDLLPACFVYDIIYYSRN